MTKEIGWTDTNPDGAFLEEGTAVLVAASKKPDGTWSVSRHRLLTFEDDGTLNDTAVTEDCGLGVESIGVDTSYLQLNEALASCTDTTLSDDQHKIVQKSNEGWLKRMDVAICNDSIEVDISCQTDDDCAPAHLCEENQCIEI